MGILICIILILIVWGYLDYTKELKEEDIRLSGGLTRLFPNFIEYCESDLSKLKTPFAYERPDFVHDITGSKLYATYGNEKITKDGRFLPEQSLIIEIGIEHYRITEYYCSAHYPNELKDLKKIKVVVTNRKNEPTLEEYHQIYNQLYNQLLLNLLKG